MKTSVIQNFNDCTLSWPLNDVMNNLKHSLLWIVSTARANHLDLETALS